MKPNEEDINFKSLVEIAGGDEAFIREMLILFCEKSESLMKELNIFYQEDDFIQVSSLAHKLKSSIQIVAQKELHTLVKKIEKEAKSAKDKHAIKEIIDQLNESMAQLIKAIEKRLENPKKFTRPTA